ncbi:MAG TPA: transporter [Ferruginibacter sp.]|nr:hypothetical protein [Chitinophagaceae bacterium]HRI25088.1 transporter [Ferruginibacter sp.]
MKKLLFLFPVFLCASLISNACEICGCGHSNYYIGLLPKFKHAYIGLRYQYKHFNTVMADDKTQFSRDYFKTVELWGGWNIGKRWQVLAVIPYTYIHQVSDEGVANNQGIGDVAAMVNYKLFDRSSALSKKTLVQQQLWIGAGIKVPTGKFSIDETDPAVVALANTQTGTASTDFMINGTYDVRINKVGITTNASYKINTSNRDNYLFGNKFSAASFVSYSIQKNQLLIVPNAGLQYEDISGNKLNKELVTQTGGRLLTASGGLEFSFRQFTIGTNFQLPVSQHFASGQTELKSRGMVHFSVAF